MYQKHNNKGVFIAVHHVSQYNRAFSIKDVNYFDNGLEEQNIQTIEINLSGSFEKRLINRFSYCCQ